ncbi:jg21691, partial [Pararge aegeria aegeria]
HLGSPATLHEALGYLGGLLSFWSELSSAAGMIQRGAASVATRTTDGFRPTKCVNGPGEEEGEKGVKVNRNYPLLTGSDIKE